MFNNVKLGTKLMVGFLGTVALTVIVGVYGLYVINTCAVQTAILDKMGGRESLAYKVQGLLMEASWQFTQGTETKSRQSEKDAIDNCDKALVVLEDALVGATPDGAKAIEALIAEAKVYHKGITDWFAKDVEAAQKKTARSAAGSKAVKLTSDVRDSALELAKKSSMPAPAADTPASTPTDTPAPASTPPSTVVSERFFDRVCESNDIVVQLWTARRDNAAYETALADEKTEGRDEGRKFYREAVDTRLKALLVDFDTLEGKLALEANKERVREAKQATLDWITAANDYYNVYDTMNGIQKMLDGRSVAIVAAADQWVKAANDGIDAARNTEGSVRSRGVMLIYIVIAIAVFVGIATSMTLTRHITSGIRTVVSLLTRLAATGDLTIKFDQAFLTRRDEMGDLAQSTEHIMAEFRQVDALAGELARGNWTMHIKAKGDHDSMNQSLSRMLEDVSSTLREISRSVSQVTTGATEISSAATSLSNGAESSAASLEEISASMNEIQSQTKANASSAGSARDLAKKMTTAAVAGQSAMKDMNESMVRITTNSQEVQRVIKVIDDIAFQTNLLALNAAVEAARAGQHGKGFAVVAEEVRNLAARSAKAAQETASLIANSGEEIKKGGSVATHTATVLDSIVEQIRQTSDLVAGIAVASDEQAQGVGQVTIGLQQIDGVIQQNTAAAEESASAANEMSGMAQTLQKMVGRFQLRA